MLIHWKINYGFLGNSLKAIVLCKGLQRKNLGITAVLEFLWFSFFIMIVLFLLDKTNVD